MQFYCAFDVPRIFPAAKEPGDIAGRLSSSSGFSYTAAMSKATPRAYLVFNDSAEIKSGLYRKPWWPMAERTSVPLKTSSPTETLSV